MIKYRFSDVHIVVFVPVGSIPDMISSDLLLIEVKTTTEYKSLSFDKCESYMKKIFLAFWRWKLNPQVDQTPMQMSNP